jgi:hypothetical protein
VEAFKFLPKEYSDHMLWKDFLVFKIIIWVDKLSNKLKNSHENFSGVMKSRDLQESPTWKKFGMTVFEFIGEFFFQNDVFKFQEVF